MIIPGTIVSWATSPRIITIPSPITDINIVDLQDTLLDLEDDEAGMPFPHLRNTSGGEWLDDTTRVGWTLELQNAKLAFEARPGPDYVQCRVAGGNIVAVDLNGDTMSPIQPTAYTSVLITASSSATTTEQAAIQYSSFNGGVTIDILNGAAGVEFPQGTPRAPVNNLADAMTIATTEGFPTIFVIGDLTVDNGGDYSGMQFIGTSTTKSHVTIDDDANVLNCEFFEATIDGTLDGNAQLRDCRILNLNYINGVVESCLLGPGTIVLGGGSEAHFIDCKSGVATEGDYPVIDCGGSGQTLAMRRYDGEILIINKTGPENVVIDLAAGNVLLDSTITAGNIVLRGIGTHVDNTTGTAVVDSTTLINSALVAETVYHTVGEEIQQSSFADRVCIDTINGAAGTAFPLGTETNPVNNITDAKTIAGVRGVDVLHLLSNLTIATGESVDDYTIQSDDWLTVTVEAGSSVVNTVFERVTLYGVMSAYWNILVDCWIYDITEFSGWVRGGSFENIALSVAVPGAEFGGMSYFDDVVVMYPGVSAQLTMNTGVSVSFTGVAESCEIHSMTSGSTLVAGLAAGEVIIDASCTGGDITVIGTGNAINNSGLTIDTTSLLNSDLIAETVYETVGEEIQQASFANGVCLDALHGDPGTAYPLGIHTHPIDNLADTVTVATNRGFRIIRPHGDFTFAGSDSVSYLTIEGGNRGESILTFTSGCILAYCAVRSSTCTGLGFGITSYEDCKLSDFGSSGLIPSSSTVYMRRCLLDGTLTIPSNYSGKLTVLDCRSNNAVPAPPIVDLNNSAIQLVIRKYSGSLKIINCSNLLANISIEIAGGVMLDSTVTAGTIGIRGIGSLVNNGTVTPDTIGYISNPSIADATWDEAIADHLGTGATGEALSDAGASGNPWSTPITGNTNPGTFGELIAKKLLKFATWIGFK